MADVAPVRLAVRPVRSDELAAAGALTVAAYVHEGSLADDDRYLAELADTAVRAAQGELLVAVDDDGRLLGTVTLCPRGTPFAEIARPGELELRMLAVAPEAQRRGVGAALVAAVVERARARQCARVVASVVDRTEVAHRLYRRLGFDREPARDWTPVPGVSLLVYSLAV